MSLTPSPDLIRLSGRIDSFLNDFTAFAEKLQFSGAILNNPPLHEALVGLTWRSIENLEAIAFERKRDRFRRNAQSLFKQDTAH
jgi:hypothetical protein